MSTARYRGGRGRGGFRGGRGGARAGGSITPLKGKFENGIWHCNCSPRLPAEHFKVKKESKNQGRWFYTCQLGEGKRCDFFLWDEDAKLRTEAAVMSNSRTEPQRASHVQEGWNAGRTATPAVAEGRGLFSTPARGGPAIREDSPTPTPSPTPPTNSSRKRNAAEAKLDDEDASQPWSLNGDEEEELLRVASSSESTTPRSKAPKTGVYATPATTGRKSPRTIPWLQQPEPATPGTSKKTVVDYFDTPSKPPSKTVTFQDPPPTTSTSSPSTPKPIVQDIPSPSLSSARPPAAPSSPSPPARYKDALSHPAEAPSSLTHQVLSCLTTLPLPPEKLSHLRGILTRHDLRTQGVTKGREISRLAVRAKEAKIAELEARIASLEAAREVDRSVIARLRWKRESGGTTMQEEDGDWEEESQL
ncbi:hypothetical protein DOTSEDRAFT_31087 [Lecanosticta acicola]|uniref:GRF-type domain-containing protein n=1 Tax=Lecanosticta acicola TaxID=111012 RepID=A0AAI8YWR6_9PEZI|nr:hypothetical protein DOTSEDRAFT_31087 [Lecanosticta acicola]